MYTKYLSHKKTHTKNTIKPRLIRKIISQLTESLSKCLSLMWSPPHHFTLHRRPNLVAMADDDAEAWLNALGAQLAESQEIPALSDALAGQCISVTSSRLASR